jgi:hypothetical protein
MRLVHKLIERHVANWSACLNSSRKHATQKCIMGCLCRTDGLLFTHVSMALVWHMGSPKCVISFIMFCPWVVKELGVNSENAQPCCQVEYPMTHALRCGIKPWKSIGIFPNIGCIDLRERGATGWTAGVWIPAGARFFSSPQCPERLWGPPSLLSNGYRWRFPWG